MQRLSQLFQLVTSHERDFPEVAVFKRSAKGAMSSSFRRAPCTQLTISKESEKTQCLSKLFQVLKKFIRKTFPK